MRDLRMWVLEARAAHTPYPSRRSRPPLAPVALTRRSFRGRGIVMSAGGLKYFTQACNATHAAHVTLRRHM